MLDINTRLSFEIYIMGLAEEYNTAEDLQELAETLHESIENAIYDICFDKQISDYEPSY